MTESEFFYWLQGYFELFAVGHETVGTAAEDVPTPRISMNQAACIRRHAALVRTTGSLFGREFNRIEFLAEMIGDGGPVGDSDEYSRKMRVCVASQFQHVIDPQAGDDAQQAELQAVHDGADGFGQPSPVAAPGKPSKPPISAFVRPPGPDGQLYRC